MTRIQKMKLATKKRAEELGMTVKEYEEKYIASLICKPHIIGGNTIDFTHNQ